MSPLALPTVYLSLPSIAMALQTGYAGKPGTMLFSASAGEELQMHNRSQRDGGPEGECPIPSRSRIPASAVFISEERANVTRFFGDINRLSRSITVSLSPKAAASRPSVGARSAYRLSLKRSRRCEAGRQLAFIDERAVYRTACRR